jgi:hypothetical protein
MFAVAGAETLVHRGHDLWRATLKSAAPACTSADESCGLSRRLKETISASPGPRIYLLHSSGVLGLEAVWLNAAGRPTCSGDPRHRRSHEATN